MTTPAPGPLEPAALWARFRDLSQVARPPLGEEPALAHVRAWASHLGLRAVSAGGANLLVRVPATRGRDGAATVILQAHLDMVCERDSTSPYDAAQGRVNLVLEGDWLGAEGTTLGADNGIGVAAMQAVAESDAPHGPLELLFTTAEEVGLKGAAALDPSALHGRRLLNLDSEEDGVLTVGCAGATDASIRVARPQAPAQAGETTLLVTAAGAAGGHSGMDIASGRANAVKVLGRCLREAGEQHPFRLASLSGGASRNAIPREAQAVVLVARQAAAGLRAALVAAGRAAAAAHATTDSELRLTVHDEPDARQAWSAGDTATLLDLVVALPSGPLAMSPTFPGLVETSTSLGIVTTSEAALALHTLTRTSNQAAVAGVLGSLAALARLAGGSFAVEHGYPAWQPAPGSPLLATCVAAWRDLFGSPPQVATAHSGLEPALIGRHIPSMDMVSVGPLIESPHSPDERVSVSSVERFWRFLLATLAALSA